MKADDQQAIDFLKRLRPEGPWVLTAIIPDGATVTITARDADDVRAFVRTHECTSEYVKRKGVRVTA